jgi:hypothetical protein
MLPGVSVTVAPGEFIELPIVAVTIEGLQINFTVS